jgi:hypothetical protein
MIPLTQIHERSLSWLSTDTSIKSLKKYQSGSTHFCTILINDICQTEDKIASTDCLNLNLLNFSI